MSLFAIPTSIASCLETIMRDVLLNNNDTTNSCRWVEWDEVCHPKEERGLGIIPLREMNEALKTKRFCRRCYVDKWKNMICGKI